MPDKPAKIQTIIKSLKLPLTRFSGFYLTVACVFFGIIASSCSNTQSTNQDHLVFRYNEHSNISSLDPAFARNPANIWPSNQLFNGLIQLDDSLNIKPDIAKSWQYIDSTRTFYFTLRDDVYFHEDACFGKAKTRKVVAQDFTYSFNRLIDKQVASPGSWVMTNVEEVAAPNDSIVKIVLKRPFPAFLGMLGMRYFSVIPEEAITYYQGDFRKHPVGTGPFRFKIWEENVKLVLRKNPLYFERDAQGEQLPYLEAVAITFLPDKQSEFLQFLQGRLDLVNSLDNSYKDEILTADGKLRTTYADQVYMLKSPFLNTEYLGFFMESESTAIASPLLRKAVNYGFDRQKMITYLRNGIGFPAVHGFIPKGLRGYAEIPGYNYNPTQALALVEEYKQTTGDFSPTISIGTNSQYLDLCEYIQRELEKIGIAVSIEVMPPSTLRQMKSSGELDIFRASWIADYPDAENYLSLFYSPNFTPNGPNYTHYKNPVFDSLYVAALHVSNIDQREKLYTKMDSIVINEAPIVPLYYDMAVRFISKEVRGLGINPQNFLVLKHVTKTKNSY